MKTKNMQNFSHPIHHHQTIIFSDTIRKDMKTTTVYPAHFFVSRGIKGTEGPHCPTSSQN